MNHLPAPQPRPDVEAALTRLYSAPRPDAAFVDRLERELRVRAAEQRPVQRPWLLASSRGRWVAGVLGLAVILALAFAIIGPRRVLAQIQRWLDYVPGIGFVDLEGARVLTAPAQVRQDGVTLRVTQVVAQPDKTTLLFEVDGLPPPAPDSFWAGPEHAIEPVLLLPDGQPLSRLNLGGGWGRSATGLNGRLRFPPLPDGVYQVTLRLSGLPVVTPGSAPDQLELPLTLRPATGELVAELFPQPYALEAASDSHHGVSVSVLGAVHSPDLTALKLQVQWPEGTWRFHTLGGSEVELRDDIGHEYGNPPGPVNVEVKVVPPLGTLRDAPAAGLSSDTLDLTYASLSPSAAHLTLTAPTVSFQVAISAAVTIDLGSHPRAGDTWPLDTWLDVAGFPVHLSSARLWQKGDADGGMRLWLEVLADPAVELDGQYVSMLEPALDNSQFDGSRSEGQNLGGPAATRLRMALSFRSDQPAPAGPLTVRFDQAVIAVRGPWVIGWDVPGRQAAGRTPLTLQPAGAAETHSGVTLRVHAVTLTDRLTDVELGPVDSPPGASYEDYRCDTPEAPGWQCTLEDDRGHQYDQAPVGWQAASWRGSSLVYGPAQPLARQMTLRVPAVVIVRDDPASFDVELSPAAAALPLGQAWPVDTRLVVAGQAMHFTLARLNPYRDTVGLTLISAALDVAGDWLAGLRIASVTSPNGQQVGANQASSVTWPAGTAPSHDQVVLLDFVVTDPATGAVQPGRYHVELSGARIAVRGPWVLSWQLPGP